MISSWQCSTPSPLSERRLSRSTPANAILQKDLPIVYLYHSQWIFAHNAKITGMKPAPDGIIRLSGVKRTN